MTVRASIVLSRIEAAPGDIVEVPVQLTNSADVPASCRVTVVGLGSDVDAVGVALPAGVPPSGESALVVVPPKTTVEVATPVVVPSTLGIGEHAAAIEVASNRPGDRPSLTPFVVSIGSVARVELVAVPSTIRGRRRAKFKLDVVNHEAARVDLHISAEAPDVAVRFAETDMRLEPGQRALTKASVTGPRHWSGEPTQHNLVITARGRSGASAITTAAYVQRPLFAHRARVVVAGLTVIALWLGALVGAGLWWSNRQDNGSDASSEVVGQDTDGDGVLDTFVLPDGSVVTGIDTDGDGVPDAFFDADGNPVADPTAGGSGSSGAGSGDSSGSGGSGSGETADGENGDGSATGPTSTVVRGTVKADGDLSDITITLAPVALGAAPPAAVQGFAGPDRSEASKFWSAQYIPPASTTLNPVRQTEPLAPIVTNPKADGVFQIPDVPLRHSYTVVVAKPGFVTQSFVVTPTDDGSPLDLDVELVPANGAISGTVRGPNGPLGGAEITVSDGTLTFKTTAATVGEIGTWAIDQVSTPGVYTVTATLRGYGTEVRQVKLTPKAPIGIADLTMRSGVGSISGRVVGPDGQPIGGASITATDGDVSRTTSSLTEGDIGSYTIPQLTQSVNFTLLVEAPGYISQSRRTPVSGAVSGIDFSMTKTTVQLTGMVTSGATGVGIANAGLILKTGDLEFRASTAGGAFRGQFAIADLPPGEYTITVEHYQHVTATEAISLTAGVTPAPLQIALERAPGPPALGTGSLVVEVVDPAAKDAATREIKNATVRLIRTRTGEQVASLTQEAYNFRLDNIPIGTYTVLVTAPKYNDAPPRQVSIGLSEERIEVQMQRLGQASGYVIDSLTKAKLTNYFVSLYRQPENPGDAPLYVLASGPAGLWQTPPDSLIPGTYRIDISDAGSPPGYTVRNDQVLDPAVVGIGAERTMRFVVPEGVVDPITVASIEADAYPNITGRVYRPVTPPASIAYEPIDSADLTVSMSCGGDSVNATMSDDGGVTGATPPLLDSFTITKEQIDANNLTGACSLTVSATGFSTGTVPVPGVDANDGVTSSDRRLHVVLAPPAPSVGGTVFWKDGATAKPLGNVAVAATRVVRFDPVVDPALSAVPIAVATPASTSSNASGEWQLDGQVYGTAPYTFTADNFAQGVVNVTVDGSGASATAGAGAKVDEGGDGRFHVELAAPTPRTLTGVITLQSTTPDFSGLTLTATSPTGAAIDEDSAQAVFIERLPVAPATPGVLPFQIRNAQPGTWKVNVSLPPHHAYDTAPLPVEQFVDPGPAATPVPGFDISMRELAELRLTLQDGNGGAITTVPTVTLTPVGGGTVLSGPMTLVSGSTFQFTDIPVAASNPATVAKAYTMQLALPGYDVTGYASSPVSFLAGETKTLGLTVPKFGTISGVVEGQIATASYESITLCDPNVPTYATCTDGKLTATMTDASGSVPVVPQPTIAIAVSGNQYTITGPPGYYAISITHPQFQPQTAPLSIVPSDNFVDALPPGVDPPGVNGVFRLVNDRPNTPSRFVLQIIRGTLSIETVRTLAAPATPVTDATYILTRSGESTLVGAVPGSTSVSDLYPGVYQLQLREYATPQVPASGNVAFPVITSISIERAAAGVGGSTTVRAPLPPLRPSVTGTIGGRNLAGAPVPLPSGATFAVTSTFDEPSIEIDGTSTVPDPAQGNASAVVDATNQAGGTVGYEFQNVPVGAHKVTLAITPSDAMNGYTLTPAGSLTKDLIVTTSGVVAGPTYVFTVPNVTVHIKLSAGDYPGMSGITLTSPSLVNYLGTFDDATDTLTFVGVGPEIGSFAVAFHDELHAPHGAGDPGVAVPVDLVAPFEANTNLTTTPALGRLSGLSTMRDSPTVTSPLGTGATIAFTGVSAGASCLVPAPACVIAVSAALPSYSIDLKAGSYDIVTSRVGYQSQTLSAVQVTAGSFNTQPVQIVKLASLAVTITNTPLPTGTTVTLVDVTSSDPSQNNPPVPGVASGNTFTFANLEPAPKRYRIVVGAPGFSTQTLPSTVTYYTPAIGEAAVVSPSVTLAPRVITVNVNGGTAPAGTVVTVRFGALTFTDATAPFSFSSADIPTLPLDGTGVASADAPGYRGAKVTIPSPTTAPLPITILPLASVTGTINPPTGLTSLPVGTKVTATSPGMTSIQATVSDSTGEYTLTGLDNGADAAGDPADRVWTITYDVVGVGTGSTNITVSSTAVGTPAEITPTPALVSVTFTVKAASPNGAVDIGFNGQTRTVTPSAAGVTTTAITIPETASGVAYTVSGSGYLVHPGGTVTPPSRAAMDVPVTVVARPPITGTVMDNAATPAVVVGATVRVCPSVTPAAICPPNGNGGQIGSGATSVAGGIFTISELIPTGTYQLWARASSATGYVTLTVNADRSYSLAPSSTITIS